MLALHAQSISEDSSTAEQLLFESLFILNKQRASQSLARYKLVCGLGDCVLQKFGEVLADNGKVGSVQNIAVKLLTFDYQYRYAVASLESAAQCHRLRFDDEPHALNRRIAVLSAQNSDWSRCLKYYLKILSKAESDANINE